mmetsp:Transcript_17879/g.40522  ORF Transcript_17879/g.40522 Transcript_17879/m.40522 type:complete len:90 (-) Transcript_17879:152-421(-)
MMDERQPYKISSTRGFLRGRSSQIKKEEKEEEEEEEEGCEDRSHLIQGGNEQEKKEVGARELRAIDSEGIRVWWAGRGASRKSCSQARI